MTIAFNHTTTDHRYRWTSQNWFQYQPRMEAESGHFRCSESRYLYDWMKVSRLTYINLQGNADHLDSDASSWQFLKVVTWTNWLYCFERRTEMTYLAKVKPARWKVLAQLEGAFTLWNHSIYPLHHQSFRSQGRPTIVDLTYLPSHHHRSDWSNCSHWSNF